MILPAITLGAFALSATTALDVDRVSSAIEVSVPASLDVLQVSVRSEYTPARAVDRVTVILAADRYGVVPADLRASTARELYSGRYALGGFREVELEVEGKRCAPDRSRTLADGAHAVDCMLPGGARAGPIEVKIAAKLEVPSRYGPFSRHHDQLTLAAAWYPYVSRAEGPPPRGPHAVKLTLPSSFGAVIGHRYFAPRNGDPNGARVLEHREAETAQVPLVVLPPSSGAVAADREGRALYVVRHGTRAKDPATRAPEVEQVIEALRDALSFLRESSLPLPAPTSPWIVVQAPLRHELANATDGLTLVSDHAFRIFPVDRFYRFHRFPILREIFTAYAMDRLEALHPAGSPLLHVTADAIGAWMVDRYVLARFGSQENAFDVLHYFSFIPAIDSMLYAPDLPFVGAYFRLIDEEDPFSPNLIDYPLALPRGKIVYEKLLDRLDRAGTDAVLASLLRGEALPAAIDRALGGEGASFLATWLAPYPSVRYALGSHVSVPCASGATGACWTASVEIAREGDAIAEPVFVLLEDENGKTRVVKSEATAAPLRTVTATLSAPLDVVELDPQGRLAERPTVENPSPRFFHRSSPRWKILLNNFNVQLLATEQAINTALDIGLARVYDVHWSFALRGDYDPAAVAVSTRALYSFGPAVTAARLSEWFGLIVEGAYLRPSFGSSSDRCSPAPPASSAFAGSAALTYGYDDRRTVWAPEDGTAVRASLEYNHVFGDLSECEGTVLRAVSPDAVSLQLRGLRSWRFGGADQIAVRGRLASYLAGTPRKQLLFSLGGRTNLRGYRSDALQGRTQGLATVEWVHTIASDLEENAGYIVWVSGLDTALYTDGAVLADGFDALGHAPFFADVGLGLRLYIDYFGVRPGIMSVDFALPLFDLEGRAHVGPPAVLIDFAQSFLIF